LPDKFRSIAKKMKKIINREKWIEQIRINLEYTLSNKDIMDWIQSHKDDDNLSKPKNRIEQDYPDTRYMDWDEYERGLGEEDVDS